MQRWGYGGRRRSRWEGGGGLEAGWGALRGAMGAYARCRTLCRAAARAWAPLLVPRAMAVGLDFPGAMATEEGRTAGSGPNPEQAGRFAYGLWALGRALRHI